MLIKIFTLSCIFFTSLNACEVFSSPRLPTLLPDFMKEEGPQEPFERPRELTEEFPMQFIHADPLYCKETLNSDPKNFRDISPLFLRQKTKIEEEILQIWQENERIKAFLQRHKEKYIRYYLGPTRQRISILEKRDILDIYFLGTREGIPSSYIAALLDYEENIVSEVISDYMTDFRKRQQAQEA